MIGLAAAATIVLAPLPTAAAGGHTGPLSVAVRTSGTRDVSYTIEVHNTTDRTVPDAIITQRLPASLHYVAASPTPHRTGRDLTWTLTIPPRGTAYITTTGAADAVHHGHHRTLWTTVCAREDDGPPDCATGRGTLRPPARSPWERGGLALGAAGGAVAAVLVGLRVRRRRVANANGAVERAGVGG
jgi:uncharacterized repeat protein (TIGR01451 family)